METVHKHCLPAVLSPYTDIARAFSFLLPNLYAQTSYFFGVPCHDREISVSYLLTIFPSFQGTSPLFVIIP